LGHTDLLPSVLKCCNFNENTPPPNRDHLLPGTLFNAALLIPHSNLCGIRICFRLYHILPVTNHQGCRPAAR